MFFLHLNIYIFIYLSFKIKNKYYILTFNYLEKISLCDNVQPYFSQLGKKFVL